VRRLPTGGSATRSSGDAIDALSGGDAAAVADLLKAADVNLAAAESRLAEVKRNPGDYGAYLAQFEEAIALSRGVQVTLGAGANDGTDVRAQLAQAQAALMETGPAAGCADLSVPGPVKSQ